VSLQESDLLSKLPKVDVSFVERRSPLKIAIRIECPSAEADLLASLAEKFGATDIIDPWDCCSHTSVYDMAWCVGPVGSCPLAKKRVLFVLGPVAMHKNLDWDVVIVTSKAARVAAVTAFGHKSRVFVCPPPLLDLHAGMRRIMDNRRFPIHANSDYVTSESITKMAWWRSPVAGESVFSPLEFNSACRHGAYGFYLDMIEGYDIAVRRHLALGSPVICKPNKAVLGDLADACCDGSVKIPERVEPISDPVTIFGYLGEFEEIFRRE